MELVDDDVSLDDIGGFMSLELELLDGLVVLDSDGLELDGLELDAAELEGALASAVRQDENSVRDTAPSPSLSAVAKPDSRPSWLAASVAVTLPSESLSSVSNEAFFAGSPANAANASEVAATPVSSAEIFMVMLLSERFENGRLSWIPFGRDENVAAAGPESNVRTWRHGVAQPLRRFEAERQRVCGAVMAGRRHIARAWSRSGPFAYDRDT